MSQNPVDPAVALTLVNAQISAAAETAGRAVDAVQLIAVTKTVMADAIEPAIRAGQRDFGENRVQEAAGKWPVLRQHFPDIRLHLIGPLQTNKVREAVSLFDAIHSLDRDKLAGELAKEMARQGRRPALFVQVNIGEEPQKAGVYPDQATDFVGRCREQHGLAVEGLMCIPPFDSDAGPFFSRMRDMASQLGLPGLSMGMSGDYETAITHGATHVRVGSAIFGSRS